MRRKAENTHTHTHNSNNNANNNIANNNNDDDDDEQNSSEMYKNELSEKKTLMKMERIAHTHTDVKRVKDLDTLPAKLEKSQTAEKKAAIYI